MWMLRWDWARTRTPVTAPFGKGIELLADDGGATGRGPGVEDLLEPVDVGQHRGAPYPRVEGMQAHAIDSMFQRPGRMAPAFSVYEQSVSFAESASRRRPERKSPR